MPSSISQELFTNGEITSVNRGRRMHLIIIMNELKRKQPLGHNRQKDISLDYFVAPLDVKLIIPWCDISVHYTLRLLERSCSPYYGIMLKNFI